MKQLFVLENIKCGGCETTIKKALLKMPGVQQVTVDLEKGTVAIEGNPDTGAVLGRLSGLGYPQKANYSLLNKAKSYYSCSIVKIGKKSNDTLQ